MSFLSDERIPSARQRRPAGFRAAARGVRFLLVGSIVCGALSLTTRAAGPDSVEVLEKAAADWVKIRAETVRLQTEWSTQQQLLASMVNGLEERAQTLEAKRDYLQAKTAKDREERANLETANKASADAMAGLDAQLKTMDAHLLQLRPALPPRLAEALSLPYQSLSGRELPVGERMQLTLTILNRCTQFNRTITCSEEVLNPGGEGKAQLLDVIYWGLSHGYALDRATGNTWFGSPGPEGWKWEPLPDSMKRVTQLFAIYRSKQEPDFTAIPARLRNMAQETPAK